MSEQPIWSMRYETYHKEWGGKGGDILYRALDEADAVAAAVRWIKGRSAYPDLFGKFTYFEICPYEVGHIDERGSLNGGSRFRLMEWSQCRAGVDMDTYAAWKIAEYSRAKP